MTTAIHGPEIPGTPSSAGHRPRATNPVKARLAAVALAAGLAILAASGSLSCSAGTGGNAGGAEDVPVVVVSLLPQAEFVSRIAGDRVRVLVLVGPGQNPHSWEPSPRQLAEIARARVWFALGIEFERALAPRIAALYPELRIVDVTEGIPRRPLEEHGHEGEEEHGEGTEDADDDDHDGGSDPHTWLGRNESLAQLARVRETLAELFPERAEEIRARADGFAREIEETFAELASSLAPLAGRAVFVYHPAFGYFLDEFGIRQVAVETGGKEPTQRALAALAERARTEGARAIFVQAQFPVAAAATLAEAIGGEVVPLDDLAPDWLENLRRMGQALARAALALSSDEEGGK